MMDEKGRIKRRKTRDERVLLGSIAGAVDVKTSPFATIYILYNSNLCRIA